MLVRLHCGLFLIFFLIRMLFMSVYVYPTLFGLYLCDLLPFLVLGVLELAFCHPQLYLTWYLPNLVVGFFFLSFLGLPFLCSSLHERGGSFPGRRFPPAALFT